MPGHHMVERTGEISNTHLSHQDTRTVKQETSVIQALSAANRELSDRQHEDILEEEAARSGETK